MDAIEDEIKSTAPETAGSVSALSLVIFSF
jgi:hypothetical protein